MKKELPDALTANTLKIDTLNASNLATMPLSGRHLIEASAGTGKTYNITKLYVRLLLEKALTVQQILVMTFTKAATEELRGRIEKEVRSVYESWGQTKVDKEKDPLLEALEKRISQPTAKQLLKKALLDMDDAAIFTIHGWCSRVLTQEAFSSGLSMELAMETDTSELLLETVRDWFRKVNQDDAQFALLAEQSWHTPALFYAEFGQLLRIESPVDLVTPETIKANDPERFGTIISRKKTLLAEMDKLDGLVKSHFIDKRADQSAERTSAWKELSKWLNSGDDSACPSEAHLCLNWQLITAKNPLRAHLLPVRELKDDAHSFAHSIAKLPALAVVQEAVLSIRKRFIAAKSRLNIMDFDDLISHLADRLTGEDGANLATILRNQYPVALVDEFQDTDSRQYAILDKLYPKVDDQSALFMIGDPKQAIYSFRGGDVFAYLQARNAAGYQWHMDTNWRSLKPVVEGYNRIFFGRRLDDKPCEGVFENGIRYERILHSDHAAAVKRPLNDPQDDCGAINFAWMPEVLNPTGEKNSPVKDDWLLGLTKWCVKEIHRLLSGVTLGDQPVKPHDIAILVRTGTEAQWIREALQHSGYPSVYLSDRSNVFESEQATEMLALLQGILECENDRLLIKAVSTRLWGGTASQLAEFKQQNGEEAWEKARNRAVELRELWRKQGCMKMLLELVHQDYVPDPSSHERSLTNVLHLIELLQQAGRKCRQPQQLMKWFRDQCLNTVANDETQQRLESDGNLIRIVTQHKSKGLEYPIVFVPYACTYRDPAKKGNSDIKYYKFHDRQNHLLRYQLGRTGEAENLVRAEGHAEFIRLLYVAITRASHRCYIGVAPMYTSRTDTGFSSGLGLTLRVGSTNRWLEKLGEVVKSSDDCCRLLEITSESEVPAAIRSSDEIIREMKPAILSTWIDDQWTLASYSALKKLASQKAGIRQDQKDRDDENESDTGESKDTDIDSNNIDQGRVIDRGRGTSLSVMRDGVAVALPLRFTMKKGKQAGDLLHDILELLDFVNPDWETVLTLQRFEEKFDQIALKKWLEESLNADIPVIGDEIAIFRLSDLPREKTLREVEFYFDMKSGDSHQLEKMLQTHRGDGQDIRLSRAGKVLKGMMHGYIDLIFEYDGKYYLADYKSHHLGNSLEHYSHDALQHSVFKDYFDLQYLIYSLALHRYLANSLGKDYDPERHFGGVYYFYLRGMAPGNNHFSGIYRRKINAGELIRLDEIFGLHAEGAVV